MAGVYYKLWLPALTVGECWRASKKSFELLFVLAHKTFGTSPQQDFARACPEELIRLVPEAIDPRLRTLLDPLLQEAAELGFEDGIWFSTPVIGAASLISAMLPASDCSATLLLVAVDCYQNGISVERRSAGAFMSELDGGPILVTAASRPEEDQAAVFDVEYMPNRSLSEAIERHRVRLADRTGTVIPVASEGELEELSLRTLRTVFQRNIERGLFVPLSAAEEARMRMLRVPESTADVPIGQQQPSLQLLNMLCWLSISFGMWKLMDNAANQKQLIFRWSLVGAGLIGLAVLWLVRRLRRQS